ncbi:hypothetical protein [Marinobacter sp.]|uniref:hypothetical protein n=1 Tax=Marinobacter sp. TaxID=50741 RepID=UPI0019A98004|nr:hypothetical protein [Marinobacter sp.]MBD3655342.1 hypothetical protein [Marinobacter sp.]
MYAIEFETEIRDGIVRIPEQYTRLKNGHARVVVLLDDVDPDVRAFSNHSAESIEEWKDPREDEVWK